MHNKPSEFYPNTLPSTLYPPAYTIYSLRTFVYKYTSGIKVWYDSVAGVLDGTLIKIAEPLERIAAYKCRTNLTTDKNTI